MRGLAWGPWWIGGVMLVALAGCAENAMVLKGQVNRLQAERAALSRQLAELQNRASSLDQSNQELESLLAQAERQNKVLSDQVALLREQLGGVTAELAKLRQEHQTAKERVQALTASMRQRGAVTIMPNSSYLAALPRIDHPEVHVRRDGDVIRVELPGSVLFQPGSAQLLPEGVQLIEQVGAELARMYPEQRIGVEGHTDSDPVRNALWQSNTHLSVGRAMAVYEILVSRTRLRPGQLYVAGHGANHPVVSNATAAGRRRNQRVELVIYPEQYR